MKTSTRIIDYHLKERIGEENSKITGTGRSQWGLVAMGMLILVGHRPFAKRLNQSPQGMVDAEDFNPK